MLEGRCWDDDVRRRGVEDKRGRSGVEVVRAMRCLEFEVTKGLQGPGPGEMTKGATQSGRIIYDTKTADRFCGHLLLSRRTHLTLHY